jgi:hypothetical protein
MSTTSLTRPASPPPSASTKPQLLFLFLGLGLLSFALLWAAPVAPIVWLLGFFFGSVGIAEALERTRGLAPTTYSGAFWLAIVITVTMVAIEVRAMIRKDPARRSWLLRFITCPSTASVVRTPLTPSPARRTAPLSSAGPMPASNLRPASPAVRW